MNVTVEDLAPCKKLVRVDVEVQVVDKAFEEVSKDFLRHASLPGFRPGKAPKDMVLKKYDQDIQDEVKRKLIGEHYKTAIAEKKVEAITYPDIEEIEFGLGKGLKFAATVETAPQFELPDYRGLPAKREGSVVPPADVERAIELLRDRQANFQKVERAAADGDFVVVNYTGTCEGKPITEHAPAARGLTEQKNFWLNLKQDSFIPGFTEQLTGAKAGDKRTVKVTFPADFVTPQVAGKEGVYEVEIVEVKERVLPAMDEQFAKSYGAETLDKLREGVRQDLQNELNRKVATSIRNQIVAGLLAKVNCELPESFVAQETRNVVYNIVADNQKRGVAKELIDQQKDEIYKVASASAKDRVKAQFIFSKIAEREGVKVEREEINARITVLAANYKMTPQAFAKELEKRNGFSEIYEQLLNEKVIDFLQQNAKVEDASAVPA